MPPIMSIPDHFILKVKKNVIGSLPADVYSPANLAKHTHITVVVPFTVEVCDKV